MKSYNAIGYSLIALHLLAAGALAPDGWGFVAGAAGGLIYLLFIWFFGGVYLTDVMHMGIAHRALDYRVWFMKFMAVFYNTAGIYINPATWVNRHRHHHAFSDHDGDPNKLAAAGFWRTMWLCLFPYKCDKELARDEILQTFWFRLVANPYYAVFSQFASFGLLWLVVRNWKYALSLWWGVRVFALWINMIENYWTHDRRFGTRRYDDDHDNAMNLGEFLPVTASFSASLQNNHHHYPRFMRTSHDDDEYDFGLITVRWFNRLGLVNASATGRQKPDDVSSGSLGS